MKWGCIATLDHQNFWGLLVPSQVVELNGFDLWQNWTIQNSCTVEFRRLGQCFLDWATAVVGEADRELTCVTLTCHSSGPIYETLAQSTKSPGNGKI